MVWNEVGAQLQRLLFRVPSTDTLFNPYLDRDDRFDRPKAAHLRRDNLRVYLSAYESSPPVFMLAEAPGPRGCRFSGVPITSESQLMDPQFPFDGVQTSRADRPYTEYSAGIFWRVLEDYHSRFVVWNAVPLHPHPRSKPMAIRTPSVAEVRRFADVTMIMIDALRPERVAAIGRKAERQLQELGVSCTYVRHPSQGGARLFENGMLELLADTR